MYTCTGHREWLGQVGGSECANSRLGPDGGRGGPDGGAGRGEKPIRETRARPGRTSPSCRSSPASTRPRAWPRGPPGTGPRCATRRRSSRPRPRPNRPPTGQEARRHRRGQLPAAGHARGHDPALSDPDPGDARRGDHHPGSLHAGAPRPHRRARPCGRSGPDLQRRFHRPLGRRHPRGRHHGPGAPGGFAGGCDPQQKRTHRRAVSSVGPHMLEVQTTIEDPGVLAKPWESNARYLRHPSTVSRNTSASRTTAIHSRTARPASTSSSRRRHEQDPDQRGKRAFAGGSGFGSGPGPPLLRHVRLPGVEDGDRDGRAVRLDQPAHLHLAAGPRPARPTAPRSATASKA